MRSLAIDTSHAAGSVAAACGDRVAVRSLGAAGEHAAVLVARLTEVAEELGWSLAEADLVAVVRGPGSFTGLRVGVATAKAIVWAGETRLLGISGFELVAAETARLTGWTAGPLQVGFDAGRGEVYAADVVPDRIQPAGWRIEPAALLSAPAWIAGLPPGSRVSGPAVAQHAEAITVAGHELAPQAGWFPTATVALTVARLRAAAGEADDPQSLVPDYLRPSYADERRPAGP
jgi:tRNA threonylcarbamoyladenosine biosynthesis protein TsaB